MALLDAIYLIDEKHRHNSVKDEYLRSKKILSKKQTFKVLYCDICRKHFCPTEKYESEYKGKINDKIFLKSNKDTFISDTSFKSEILGGICLNVIDSFKIEHNNHNICERSLVYKEDKFDLLYCKDCDAYGTESNYYSNIKLGKKLKDLYIEEREFVSSFDSTLNDSIEFLIRISTFRCNSKKHSIEEITAIANVFNMLTNVTEEVEINAFYCRKCRLYFIYESEYNKIIERGIPICPIHEEEKYFNKNSDFDSFNKESMLRQFGYNVNSQENLSKTERHKIIELILSNGFMTKNEILSHLNFLLNSRKNLNNMFLALSKWDDDISFTSSLKSDNKRVVRIGAFRKIIKKDK